MWFDLTGVEGGTGVIGTCVGVGKGVGVSVGIGDGDGVGSSVSVAVGGTVAALPQAHNPSTNTAAIRTSHNGFLSMVL